MSDDRRERALAAVRILADPVFQSITKRLYDDSFVLWRTQDDPVDREQTWHRVRGLDEFLSSLRVIADDLKVLDAAAEAERAGQLIS